MDKLRRVFPLRITFSLGEQPTSAKLTAVSEQTRNGLAVVESAIGDLWTQSGDSLMTSYPLQIPNLARVIGENKYLNPAIYPMDDDFEYIEDIGDAHKGLSEFHLTYKPKTGEQATITVTGTNITGSSEASERVVDANGEYWVDVATGRFRSYQALSGDETITYLVDPSEWLVGEETLPSIIPDPRQADFTSCRVSLLGGVYTLHLPPRQPLTLDSTSERPASYPLAADVTANLAASTANPQRFWQDPAVNAFTAAGAERYRYTLPKEIQDAGFVGEEELPAGFLYLYNSTTGTIISDVVFSIPTVPTGYTLVVSSDSFDFDTVDTADETEASYNSTNLVLITCGAPITRTIWTLMSALFMHKHEKGTTLDATISHSDLDDINPPSDDYDTGEDADHKGRYPTHLPAWAPSNWLHDTHTSMLSRAGSQGAGFERDTFNNAMLGDLVIAQADTAGGELYLDGALAAYDSFKIRFGDDDGPSIYAPSGAASIRIDPAVLNLGGLATLEGIATGHVFAPGKLFLTTSGGPTIENDGGKVKIQATGISVGGLEVFSSDGNAYGLRGESTAFQGVIGESTSGNGVYALTNTGDAIRAASTSGYSLYLSSNTTKAALHITRQANAPTGACLQGDIYVNSGDDKLYICTVAGAGVGATWVSVGSQ